MANVAQFFRSLFSKSAAIGPDLSFGLIASTGAENLLRQQQCISHVLDAFPQS